MTSELDSTNCTSARQHTCASHLLVEHVCWSDPSGVRGGYPPVVKQGDGGLVIFGAVHPELLEVDGPLDRGLHGGLYSVGHGGKTVPAVSV